MLRALRRRWRPRRPASGEEVNEEAHERSGGSARRGEEEPGGGGRARVRSARWLTSSSSIRLGEEGRRRKKGGRAGDIYTWPLGTEWKGDPVPKEVPGEKDNRYLRVRQ